MNIRWTAFAWVVVLGGCSYVGFDNPDNRLPPAAKEILENAAELKLLSLAGTIEIMDAHGNIVPADRPDTEDRFHGWVVRGQTTIKDARTRRAVLAALRQGIAENDGTRANCFDPHHGLRATYGERTVELEICYRCMQIRVHVDGQKSTILTSQSSRPLLDQILQDAGAPIEHAINCR